MILVIDIGNTTTKLTGISGDSADGNKAGRYRDFSILFEEKIPTETGKIIARFLPEAEQLLAQHNIFFLTENDRSTGSGIHRDSETKESGRVDAEKLSSVSETESSSAGKSAETVSSFLNRQVVEAVAISSVVPASTPAAIGLAEMVCPDPPVLISCRSNSGLSFDRLPAPERVGTDRIADAAWAAARYPLPAMTADLGTATTINVIAAPGYEETIVSGNELSADSGILRRGALGTFLGGMIGAGVRTSLHALRTGTAQLPELEPRYVSSDNLIGIDTDGCMLSSAVVGTAAMIEGLAARVEEQMGMPVTLILTGGNSRYVSPWIRRPFIYEPSLAPKGAAVIALRELAQRKTGS